MPNLGTLYPIKSLKYKPLSLKKSPQFTNVYFVSDIHDKATNNLTPTLLQVYEKETVEVGRTETIIFFPR